MRSGRRAVLRNCAIALLLAPAFTIAFVTAACGVDVVGGNGMPADDKDGRSEASLPPTGDAPDTLKDVVGEDSPSPPADTGPPDPCGPDLKGPTMVPIPDAGFCIDSTEVTGAQYAELLIATGGGVDASFLDASVFDGGLPPFCTRDGLAPNGTTGMDAGPPNEPVTNINWCDAYVYCAWAGKRLCTGGASGEWLTTCTRAGDVLFPSTTGDASDCNVGRSSVAPPKSFPLCEGGYVGVFDMFGNVAEWVDDCDAGGSSCALYGAYYGHSVFSSCATTDRVSPNSCNFGRGIRCCR